MTKKKTSAMTDRLEKEFGAKVPSAEQGSTVSDGAVANVRVYGAKLDAQANRQPIVDKIIIEIENHQSANVSMGNLRELARQYRNVKAL